MLKSLFGLALVGLLVACTDQDGEATAQPTGSVTGGVGGAAGDPTPDCEDAFSDLVQMDELGRPHIFTLTTLGELSDEVRPTVDACESVADWIAGAQRLIEPTVNPNTASLLLRIQCDDQSLADAPICEEL